MSLSSAIYQALPDDGLKGCSNATENDAVEASDNDAKLAGTVELYNLAEDIGEKSSLAVSQPAKVKEWRARLASFLKDAAPPGSAAAKPAARRKAKAK